MSFWRLGLAALLASGAGAAVSQPNLAWSHRYAGSFGADDQPYSSAFDSQGNLYVTGSTTAGYDPVGDVYRKDCITLKYDPAGNLLWSRVYGAGDALSQEGLTMCIGPDNFCYVAGTDGWDYFALKYDPSGVLNWVGTYSGAGTYDIPTAIGVDNLGFVAVTGTAEDIDLVSLNYLTCRFDMYGTLEWGIRYNGTGQGLDFARALKIDAAGNIHVTGYSEGQGTGFDCVTIKYNVFGDSIWTARYDAGGDDGGNDLAVDAVGDVYVTGASPRTGNDEMIVLKYGFYGDPIWAKRYVGSSGGIDSGRFIEVHPATQDILMTGFSLRNGQGYDFLTTRWNSAGTLLWAHRYNGPGNGPDLPVGLRVDTLGSVYVAGTSAGASTGTDFAVIKIEPAGNVPWTLRYDSGGLGLNDEARAFALAGDGSLAVSGTVQQGTTNFVDIETIKYSQNRVVSGSVTLLGFGRLVAGQVVSYQIRPVDSLVVLQSGQVTLGSTGQYSIGTSLPVGSYDLTIKGAHWLKRKKRNVAIGATGAVGVDVSLNNGDVDGDNEVSIGDYSPLSNAFGSSPGAPNWNPMADLDGDGEVSIGDFAQLSTNFGLIGDE
ncbi:MAG TPA: SBBP repeat-containing protein [Fimbriimonadaceae bacterium]|nr:SBBP repeat-containing protein [Fimbriimonadaceae bacterium]HRJ96050.1 SBBP repeat-containing protein [Fimbriimonadaceae bacterium]